jgi:Transcriptional regulatory protein, C terminal
MKWKIVSFFLGICLVMILVAFVKDKSVTSDFEAAKELIIMRKIAHRVLQYTGDSISRVQPVKQVSENEFRIPFETGFSFQPDSLVRIISEVITMHNLPPGYIVNVSECSTGKVFFGYAILGSQQTDIVPCLGRSQSVLQYCINIKFQGKKKYITKPVFIAGISLMVLGLLVFGIARLKKKNKIPETKETGEIIGGTTAAAIGNYLFYPEQLLLVYKDEKIGLTIKEAKLLSIFAAHANEIVDRNKLQKEVWEDEGVIVGRSLDVFISRLRKKLEKDPDIQLVNIHGKGYKLETGAKDV